MSKKGADAARVETAAFLAWAGISLVMLGLLIVLGHARGHWFGAFIDGRNRYSLSKIQITLWTITVLGSWLAIAMTRAASGIEAGQILQVSIPGSIVAALGLSSASFAFSTGIKSAQSNRRGVVALRPETKLRMQELRQSIDTKTTEAAAKKSEAGKQAEDSAERAALELTHEALTAEIEVLQAELDRLTARQEEAAAAQGLLVTNADPSDAHPTDVFSGEQVGEAHLVDMGKVQMFFITLAIVGSYALALRAGVDDRSFFGTGENVSFPEIPESMVTIFALSHGGYLAMKLPTKAPSNP